MAGVAHLLDASITSALALKPSTVYVVRVENSKTRATWHLRKCFSEFCELREKVIALIDGTSATSTSSSGSSPGSTAASSSSTSTGIASSFDSSHTCSSSSGSESYLESSITTASSCSSSTSSDRFPFLYKQFPRRQLFGSRSKKVIEQRTHALNAFVHQLLLYVREVKQQNQIAVYFSMMSFVETFFECAVRSSSSSLGSNSSCYGRTVNLSTFSLNSPSTLAKTQAAAAAAAARAAVAAPQGFRRHHHPHHSPFSFRDYEDEDDENDDSASDRDSDIVVAPVDAASNKNNFNFARRFYQEYGNTTTHNDGNDSDDEETKLVLSLKKTASCIVHRELKEMKMHFSGSHYAPMQSTDMTSRIASGSRVTRKNNGMSASDAWAARIEIAGFSTAAAVAGAGRNVQVQNSSKLAIGANRVAVRHHSNHSSNKKNNHSASAASPVAKHQHHDNNDDRQTQTQAASIVYATKQQQQSQHAKALMLKHKQLHASAAAGGRRVAREERPEWA